MDKFTVLDLLQLDLKEHDALNLKCIAGRPGLVREITVPELNRPGLALSGFFENFAEQRLQIFRARRERLSRQARKGPSARRHPENIHFPAPLLRLHAPSRPDAFFSDLSGGERLPHPPDRSIVFGVLHPGDPGLEQRLRPQGNHPRRPRRGVRYRGAYHWGERDWKERVALELIERGHRLVADDAVEVRCVSGNFLMGKGVNTIASHHMEIRGLGIINVTHLFGVGAIRDAKQIQLVVPARGMGQYQRIRPDRAGGQHHRILGVNVPACRSP